MTSLALYYVTFENSSATLNYFSLSEYYFLARFTWGIISLFWVDVTVAPKQISNMERRVNKYCTLRPTVNSNSCYQILGANHKAPFKMLV